MDKQIRHFINATHTEVLAELPVRRPAPLFFIQARSAYNLEAGFLRDFPGKPYITTQIDRATQKPISAFASVIACLAQFVS